MTLTFGYVFWAIAAAATLFFSCLLAASATIGQLKMAWRNYMMGIIWFALMMAAVYAYHADFGATNTSSLALLFYGAVAIISLFCASYHFREAWRTH